VSSSYTRIRVRGRPISNEARGILNKPETTPSGAQVALEKCAHPFDVADLFQQRANAMLDLSHDGDISKAEGECVRSLRSKC
jgi:hypothetical protein